MSTTSKCVTCGRDPERMNSHVAECSHVDCPNRRKAWSERPRPAHRGPWPKSENGDPIPLDITIRKATR
jgi:hypothetical protein